MLHIDDTVICHDCFGNISKAKAILDECNSSPCTADHYERIGFLFSHLAFAGRASQMQVLATYSQAMASYCRLLQNTAPEEVTATEHELLRDGIQRGLHCQQGANKEHCVEQNFDRLWPLIAEIRAQIKHSELSHSAVPLT